MDIQTEIRNRKLAIIESLGIEEQVLLAQALLSCRDITSQEEAEQFLASMPESVRQPFTEIKMLDSMSAISIETDSIKQAKRTKKLQAKETLRLDSLRILEALIASCGQPGGATAATGEPILLNELVESSVEMARHLHELVLQEPKEPEEPEEPGKLEEPELADRLV